MDELIFDDWITLLSIKKQKSLFESERQVGWRERVMVFVRQEGEEKNKEDDGEEKSNEDIKETFEVRLISYSEIESEGFGVEWRSSSEVIIIVWRSWEEVVVKFNGVPTVAGGKKTAGAMDGVDEEISVVIHVWYEKEVCVWWAEMKVKLTR